MERRNYKETGFLDAVAEIAITGNVLFCYQRKVFVGSVYMKVLLFLAKPGVTPAEKLLKLYNGDWGQSVDPLFHEMQY